MNKVHLKDKFLADLANLNKTYSALPNAVPTV